MKQIAQKIVLIGIVNITNPALDPSLHVTVRFLKNFRSSSARSCPAIVDWLTRGGAVGMW